MGSTWGDHPGDPIPGYSLPCGYIVEYDQAAPVLRITNVSPGVVSIAWSPAFPGFTLQETTSLAPTN